MATLREFVYLDDVSVYSLLASRLGAIAAEFTATETSALQAEMTGSGSSSIGVAKAEVGTRVSTTQSQSSQVLRKAIIQTSFKELYEYEHSTFVLSPRDATGGLPHFNDRNELFARLVEGDHEGWAVSAEELSRGSLIEVDVELNAATLHRINAVFSAAVDIFYDNAAMLPSGSQDELEQARALNQLLEKLLVGLVPIEGRSLRYDVVEHADKSWLVDREVTSKLPSRTGMALRVVGVAEQSLFWKDTRRVLYSRLPYRMLCRVAQSGIQESWTPVKLVDVLRDVIPDLAEQIDAAGRGAIAAMGSSNAGTLSAERGESKMRTALVDFAAALAETYGKTVSEDELADEGLLSVDRCATYKSPMLRREAFADVAAFINGKFKKKHDAIAEAHLRAAALVDADLLLTSGASSDTVVPPQPNPVVDERVLDTEIVAIYW